MHRKKAFCPVKQSDVADNTKGDAQGREADAKAKRGTEDKAKSDVQKHEVKATCVKQNDFEAIANLASNLGRPNAECINDADVAALLAVIAAWTHGGVTGPT